MARLGFSCAGLSSASTNQVFGVMSGARCVVTSSDTQYAYAGEKSWALGLHSYASTMDYALTYFIRSANADLSQPASSRTSSTRDDEQGCGGSDQNAENSEKFKRGVWHDGGKCLIIRGKYLYKCL